MMLFLISKNILLFDLDKWREEIRFILNRLSGNKVYTKYYIRYFHMTIIQYLKMILTLAWKYPTNAS